MWVRLLWERGKSRRFRGRATWKAEKGKRGRLHRAGIRGEGKAATPDMKLK